MRENLTYGLMRRGWESSLLLYIYKFLRMKNLELSRTRIFCINGGITVFKTRFTHASNKLAKAAVS